MTYVVLLYYKISLFLILSTLNCVSCLYAAFMCVLELHSISAWRLQSHI